MNLNQDKFFIVNIGQNLPMGEFTAHSRFENAVNFINSNKEVLSLVNDIGNMAANAICIGFSELAGITSLQVEKSFIVVNGIKINSLGIPLFDSACGMDKEKIVRIEKMFFDIRKHSYSLFPCKSLMVLYFPEMESQFSSGFDKAFLQQSKFAFEQFRNGKVLEGVKMFRGTGYGFTPSGDDFNAGFLFGLNILEQKFDKDLSEFKHQVYSIAIGGNPVVNTFLLLASQARYFNRLKKALFLLPGKDKTATSEAFQPLLTHGETSGADLLAGLITSIHYKSIV